MSRTVNIHAQDGHADGEPVGRVYVYASDGPTMAVVVRVDPDGVMRVEISNPGERMTVDVFVNDERVHETLPI